jgi:hypothetical protein
MTGQSELSEIDRYALDCIESRVRYLIGKYGLIADDRSDLIQQLFLEYLERVGDYDPARSTHKTFIACLVRNRVSSLIRARRTALARDFSTAMSMERCVIDSDRVTNDDAIATRRSSRSEANLLALRLDVYRAVEALPPHLQIVTDQIVAFGPTDTARNVGRSRIRVYQWLAEIRVAFEHAGLAPLARGAR